MAKLTLEEAKQVLVDWRQSFGKATNIEQWFAHMSDKYVEFHPIYPALIEHRMFNAFQGTRYHEPPRFRGPRFNAGDELVRIYENAILQVSAGNSAKLEADGTITYHINRETWVFVRVNGKWLMTHDHVSPPGNDSPVGHNQFATGQLRYTT